MENNQTTATRLGRRGFLGFCCAAHGLSGSRSSAQASVRPLICTAPPPERASGLEFDRYSAISGISIEDLTARSGTLDLQPYGVGFVRDRWRLGDGMNSGPPNRILLGVHFLNGSDDAKALVRQTAPEWLLGDAPPAISFRFDVPRDDAQIRIAFDNQKGNWSQVGRVNIYVPRTEATMNIADQDVWVVRHEFGHALGLQHEHLHPDHPFQWNEDVVIKDVLRSNPTWTKAYARKNIIESFPADSGARCVGNPNWDRDSVMMYPIPADWTVGGVFSQPQNKNISVGDRRCLSGIYRL